MIIFVAAALKCGFLRSALLDRRVVTPTIAFAMNHPLSHEDLSLLVRALHRDVSELDDRLRQVEKTLQALQLRSAVDLRVVEAPTR